MSFGDIVVLILLGCGIAAAIFSIRKSRKRGGCAGCSHCSQCGKGTCEIEKE